MPQSPSETSKALIGNRFIVEVTDQPFYCCFDIEIFMILHRIFFDIFDLMVVEYYDFEDFCELKNGSKYTMDGNLRVRLRAISLVMVLFKNLFKNRGLEDK